MANPNWVEEFPGMISVCDTEGIILAMNRNEIEHYKDKGGEKLIGTNLFDCHKERSVKIIKRLMETQKTRVYTVEEKGKKELVIQSPWYQDGKYSGLVEIVVPIEGEIQRIVR
jgi:transcriptional regulator with PAS, ATPase and Fis domain